MSPHRACNLALAIVFMLSLAHLAALEAGAPSSMAELHAMEAARSDALAAAQVQRQRERAAAKACPGGLMSEWLEPDAPGLAPSLVCHARRGGSSQVTTSTTSTTSMNCCSHSALPGLPQRNAGLDLSFSTP